MTDEANPVRWIRAARFHHCSECADLIFPGSLMAVWIEITFEGYVGTRIHTKRHYCESDGKLLEDSLTTTETA
jgi:hypothetical protein